MSPTDIDAVVRIERDVFPDPWPRSAFTEIVDHSNHVNLVLALADGAVAGYVIALAVADEIQVQNIALDVSVRRRGYGRLLLREAEAEGQRRGARCAILDVRAGNEPALALYLKSGYHMIGRRKDYYRRPVEDALVLFRRLDGMTPAGTAGDL
jgi:ribosomal-protein-alanine N-acetyltransferase